MVKEKGEYKNGKRNGKGKENKGNDGYNGVISFEGEYIYGKRNGFGKDYINDILDFEGYYFNGIKNGKGKSYNRFGDKIYEGEYFNGKAKD